eukprot:scaffold1949_cov348-Pavlova_lutheri.AAC.21
MRATSLSKADTPSKVWVGLFRSSPPSTPAVSLYAFVIASSAVYMGWRTDPGAPKLDQSTSSVLEVRMSDRTFVCLALCAWTRSSEARRKVCDTRLLCTSTPTSTEFNAPVIWDRPSAKISCMTWAETRR